MSSLVKVFSDEVPQATSRDSMSIFRNERASFQVAVCSDTDATLTVQADSAIKENLHLYTVQEIYSRTPVGKGQDDYTLRKAAGYFPELLCPMSAPVQLSAGKWLSIWVEAGSNSGLPAGLQLISIDLTTETDRAHTEFTLDVIDADLPKQSLIFTDWFHTDCIATYYDVKVFSERYWELVENYLHVAREHGMNMVLTPLFTPPLDTKKGKERPTVQLVGVTYENGEYRFDFKNLDKWVSLCDKIDIRYFELSHFFTQWGAKKCPKIMAAVKNKNGQLEEKRIFGWNTRGAGKRYRAFLSAFAPAFKNYLKERNLNERVYFHVSDEPSAQMLRSYTKAAKSIREIFGEFPIIDALSEYKYFQSGLVRLPIPANNHITPFIGNVPELWTYYCCVQTDRVSNRFFSMPSQRNRVLGYQMYKYNVKGFLHWGYNFWYKQLSTGPIDPFSETDAGGSFPSGDSFVVYPGKDGTPLVSLRLKVFYDALQDMRALQLLEQLIGKEKTLALLEEGIAPITFTDYPHSDEWQLDVRERINLTVRFHLGK